MITDIELNSYMIFQNNLSYFFFTNRLRFKNFFSVIESLPKNSYVISREYDLSFKEKLLFAQKIKKFLRKKNKLIIAKDINLAFSIKSFGLHFSDKDRFIYKYLNAKKSNKNLFLTCSCHKETSLIKFRKYNIDILFYSPVFKTSSHPGNQEIGILKFSKLSRKYNVVPLGGINSSNIGLIKRCKINSIAGISLFVKTTT